MELSRNQFDILVFLEGQNPNPVTQRGITKQVGLSVGTVNKTLSQLGDLGFWDGSAITGKGLEALEPYRVKRAIFIAAGFGSRLVPITLNTPKPLVRVKGKRIIDTLLDAVVAAGIKDIIIVRGYLGEQFDQLLYKYPDIKFLENPIYNESNNISSVMCVRYLMQNSYLLESDLFLSNPALIAKYQYSSNYLGVPTERTDDWCFETKNGVIAKIKVGGKNCHHMFGISYWNAKDGAKLADHIKQVYDMPGGKERYWDLVALDYFIKDYDIEVRECSFNDIIEIDTFNELEKTG
ncbi:sugar phosphate nucleotidyltransferase [Leadbettera azotonutricia]|uniref:Choline kinase n=1 Tax=Leadbettera azotonutricia (strain ATCC BAA-888 / DSM 13862 / ZAS-9) TaxID=545695 RepID=F5YAY3_LEAAZ|nr:sugar phosphate nucleotidyltransferase [Leadbettera azotonutricia]AEF81707.1 choline kinase [Leadbettera azotonutricia ZAS-9]